MDSHVKVVAWIYIVLGFLGVLCALGMLLLFGGIAGIVGQSASDADARTAVPVLGLIGAIAFFALAVVSLPSILVGWGLLGYKEWARILGIILGALHLLGFPIGTAIGIYTLWTLLNQQTIPLFQQRPPVVPQPQV